MADWIGEGCKTSDGNTGTGKNPPDPLTRIPGIFAASALVMFVV